MDDQEIRDIVAALMTNTDSINFAYDSLTHLYAYVIPSQISHSELADLANDDHELYLRADGHRWLTADLNVSVGKKIDGRDISADGVKLDGIAVGATNTRNIVYHVKDYGLVGDGITDDSSALQALVNLLIAAGQGAAIYFPRGIYKLYTYIDCHNASGILFTGDGTIATTLDFSADSLGRGLYHVGSRSQIERMTIKGNSVSGGDVVLVDNRTNVQMNEVVINGGYNGLSVINNSGFYSCYEHRYANVGITNVTNIAFNVNASVFDSIGNILFESCTVSGTPYAAFSITNSLVMLLNPMIISTAHTWDIDNTTSQLLVIGLQCNTADYSKIKDLTTCSLICYEGNYSWRRTVLNNIQSLTLSGTLTDDGTLYFWDTSKYLQSGTAPDITMYLHGYDKFDIGDADLAGVGDLTIKVYSQTTIPTLDTDHKMAIWIDTDDANKVYLVFRRGSGDQVKVQLS